MAWKVKTIMQQREEFVNLANQEGANIRRLCRERGVSPATAYKWLARWRAHGPDGLADRSRRPHASPARVSQEVERLILDLRGQRPDWGARKIRRRLSDLGRAGLPAPSTITEILRRAGQIDEREALAHRFFERFEKAAPNELWQMDFKGHFATASGPRCHPLGILDDHSRYCLGLFACADETTASVRACLEQVFRHSGLPERILADNGAPWGNDREHRWTPLGVWLLRLGVDVSHGRPYHPQTQGKIERFNRTLHSALLSRESFADLDHSQRSLDRMRLIYNTERPHQALAMDTPAAHWQRSPRPFPETLEPVAYDEGTIVRKVQSRGFIHYAGRAWRVAKAFRGQPVALRQSPEEDEVLHVFFLKTKIARIELRDEIGAPGHPI